MILFPVEFPHQSWFCQGLWISLPFITFCPQKTIFELETAGNLTIFLFSSQAISLTLDFVMLDDSLFPACGTAEMFLKRDAISKNYIFWSSIPEMSLLSLREVSGGTKQDRWYNSSLSHISIWLNTGSGPLFLTHEGCPLTKKIPDDVDYFSWNTPALQGVPNWIIQKAVKCLFKICSMWILPFDTWLFWRWKICLTHDLPRSIWTLSKQKGKKKSIEGGILNWAKEHISHSMRLKIHHRKSTRTYSGLCTAVTVVGEVHEPHT